MPPELCTELFSMLYVHAVAGMCWTTHSYIGTAGSGSGKGCQQVSPSTHPVQALSSTSHIFIPPACHGTAVSHAGYHDCGMCCHAVVGDGIKVALLALLLLLLATRHHLISGLGGALAALHAASLCAAGWQLAHATLEVVFTEPLLPEAHSSGKEGGGVPPTTLQPLLDALSTGNGIVQASHVTADSCSAAPLYFQMCRIFDCLMEGPLLQDTCLDCCCCI
jgi:hypothetical protein